jgi:DNA invertase Pin-like site-specific DNA recombinase
MNIREFIRETLKGFDYSELEQERLANELFSEVDRKDITGWEEVYEFVTEKLDRLKLRSQELYATSGRRGLDVPIESKRGRTYTRGDIIGVKDHSLDKLLGNSEPEKESVSLKEAVALVKDKLSPQEAGFLTDLSEHIGHEIYFPGNPDEIASSLHRIQENTSWIARAFYDEKEGLIIPGKLRVLRSDPLELRVGRLDQETVAHIYEAHKQDLSYHATAKEAGVSDTTVKRLWAMRGLTSRHNKFCKTERVDANKRKKIFEAHEKRMSYHKAGEYAGVSYMTIRDYWKKAGLEAHGAREDKGKGRKPLSRNKIDFLLRCHSEGKGSWETARLAGISTTTVIRYWKSEGIPITPAKTKLSPEEINEIVKLYNDGQSQAHISRQTGISTGTVKKYTDLINPITGNIKKEAFEQRPNTRCAYKPHQVKEILRAHRLYDGNIAEAARNLPYNYISIREHWLKNGLKPLNSKGRIVLTAKEKARVVSSYEESQGLSSEAASSVGLPIHLIMRIWTQNGLKPRHGPEKWRPLETYNYSKNDLSRYSTKELESALALKTTLERAKSVIREYVASTGFDQQFSFNNALDELEEKLLTDTENGLNIPKINRAIREWSKAAEILDYSNKKYALNEAAYVNAA